ncbi:MAG: glycoside hydrolase family 15 protein, partial [Chloroflexi bacterium]|nr:glycoside hydrolase family 15 protein [Chloroflexota bacterium]
MPRDLPVGNGTLLVNFDRAYNLCDVYYPHVGQENHTNGNPCRFGVWCDGQFAWLSDQGWELDLRYEEGSLVTRVTAQHGGLRLRLHCMDAVDLGRNLYLKRVVVENQAHQARDVRLFFHFTCYLWGNNVGDTAYFDPRNRALVHYKGTRYFWVSGQHRGEFGLKSYATGVKEANGLEGTWRDAEDGLLSRNRIAQGSVDSVGALHMEVPAGGSETAYFWLGAGRSYYEIRELDQLVRQRGPEVFITRTRDYWRCWLRCRERPSADLPPAAIALRDRSLLILRSQIDDSGAIIAANDSDILRFGRDTYSYMWPRDGALVAYALTVAGYAEMPRRFFDLCARIILREGYLLHKYNPDGSPGSSWHPWASPDEQLNLPIQEDETALVTWALWQHFRRFQDLDMLRPLYRPLVRAPGDFMARYRDARTGLPAPSHDLWEERAAFAEALGEGAPATTYRRAADEIKAAALLHFWDDVRGRFARMVTVDADGHLERDMTVDASLYGVWAFGMLAPDDERVVSTMRAIAEHLAVRTPVGGIARYERDAYHQVAQDVATVPGNPWFISTLWLARWHVARARTREELSPARELILWTLRHALPSSVLPEQVHPFTGEPLSVSPLTWSHAEYALAVHEYTERYAALEAAPAARPTVAAPARGAARRREPATSPGGLAAAGAP